MFTAHICTLLDRCKMFEKSERLPSPLPMRPLAKFNFRKDFPLINHSLCRFPARKEEYKCHVCIAFTIPSVPLPCQLSKRCNQLQLLPSTAQGRCNFSKCNLYLSCSACATRNICTFTFHHFFSKEETSAAPSSFSSFLFKSKLFLLITCTVWSAQCTGLFLHVPVWTAQKQTNNPHNMIWFDQMYKAISFVESESFNKTNVKIFHFHICAESKKYLFLCLGADYDKSLQFLAPQVL